VGANNSAQFKILCFQPVRVCLVALFNQQR
jgi:hypothetical protein